jgi:hypothetical protein
VDIDYPNRKKVLMFLTGLTLEVQDMVFSGKDESPVTLEIRLPSTGMNLRGELKKLAIGLNPLNGGQVEISGIRWTEGKLYLDLLLPKGVQELHVQKSARLAALVDDPGATVLDQDQSNQKNGPLRDEPFLSFSHERKLPYSHNDTGS